MGLKTTIAFLFLILSIHGLAQAIVRTQGAQPASPGKTPNANADTLSATPVNETNASQKVLLDVLIATNEDCVLLVNDEEKKAVSKNAFLYLKLSPGFYRFSAKSATSGDVYRDTFSVAVGKLNEVFIDLLYAMDVETEQRTKLASGNENTLAASQQNNSKTDLPGAVQTTSTATAREQELATINSLVAGMVPISKGSFVMGNNKSSSADEAEHHVALNPFSLGKYEVTQEQWEKIMGYNPSLNKGCRTCPVENVSWEEVMKFIRKINSLSDKKFRLPTEAEWEYVVKWGGKAEIDKAGSVEEYIARTAWNFTNSENKPHPVGTKQPNAAGVYDLLGNVSEWCADWYSAFFYKEDYTEKNPEGPPLGKDKVVRGGNYKDYLGDRFRPSFRNRLNPKAKAGEVGFRLAIGKE